MKNFSMLPRNHSCDILVKELAAFCSCPKTLPDAKVKSFGLILLAEEISKQPSINCHMDISGNYNERS